MTFNFRITSNEVMPFGLSMRVILSMLEDYCRKTSLLRSVMRRVAPAAKINAEVKPNAAVIQIEEMKSVVLPMLRAISLSTV